MINEKNDFLWMPKHSMAAGLCPDLHGEPLTPPGSSCFREGKKGQEERMGTGESGEGRETGKGKERVGKEGKK